MEDRKTIEIQDRAIRNVSRKCIGFQNRVIDFEQCAANFAREQRMTESRCVAERKSDGTFPFFQFPTNPVPTRIVFHSGNRLVELITRQSAVRRFQNLNRRIRELGWTTFDLS